LIQAVYASRTEVSITQFRRNLYKLVDKAMDGEDVWFTHRGQRFRIVPEVDTASKLSRITPLDLINPDGPGLEDESWKDEMMREWEKKWDERLPRARV